MRVVALISAALCCALLGAGARAAEPPLPKLISNNDMTNWMLFAPGSNPEIDATAEEVRQAVAASLKLTVSPGVDAVSFSPMYSTFPFWRSQFYTLADHDKFLSALPYFRDAESLSGDVAVKASPMRRALDEGFDFARAFEEAPLTTSSGRPVEKILSFRIDDAHYSHIFDVYNKLSRRQVLEEATAHESPICNSRSVGGAAKTEAWAQTAFTGFFAGFATGKLPPGLNDRCVRDHCLSAEAVARACSAGGCVIDTGGSKCPQITLNFDAGVVRQFKLMQIEDLVLQERPKAIELDFDRFPQSFAPSAPTAERLRIITDWLTQVRKATAGVRVGLRVPSRIAHRAETGIDLREIARLGLADYVILAMPYFWDQQPETEFDPAHSPLPLYFEVTHETGAPPADKKLLAEFGLMQDERYIEQLSTARQLVTGAHLAYSRGFHGLSMFNMQYYLRPSAGAPAVEYPTEAVLCMSKPECAAASDQEYVLPLAHFHLPEQEAMLPIIVGRGRSSQFSLQLAPPAKGWAGAALVSLGFVTPDGEDPKAYPDAKAALQVRLNGHPMKAQDSLVWPSDPRDGPKLEQHYKHYWLNEAPFRKLFAIDAKELIDGRNTITLEWDGSNAKVRAKVLDFRLFAAAAH